LIDLKPTKGANHMPPIHNEVLIKQAASVVNPVKRGDYLIGDVGSALVTDQGNLYLGVCIDVGSSMGFCAEHSAIGAMVTAGEYRIEKIVAVWCEGADTYILSPCGRCREFIRQIHPDNIDTQVILDTNKAVLLQELLPYHDWFHKITPES
jgi:cytidine deaminase